MRSRTLCTLALLLGLLIGAVAFAPAHLLGPVVERASDGRVQLRNVRGSLWRGQADLQLVPASGQALALPGGVLWRLAPTWSGGPALRLKLLAPCCMDQALQALARPGLNTHALTLDAHHSHWPAAWLEGLGAPWNTLQPRGQLALSTAGLQATLGRQGAVLGGSLQLDVIDLSSSLSTLRPLGSYRLQLQPSTQQGVALQLHTLQGDLSIQGKGRWSAQGLSFRGEARAAPGRETALSNLLTLLGRRQGSSSLIRLG